MSTNEIPHTHKWLTQLFRTDATIQALKAGIGVYSDRLPTTRTFPLIMFNLQAGSDVAGNGSRRLLSRPLYQIKVVHDKGITQLVSDIASRVDTLLQSTRSATFDNHVFSVRREQPITYTEPGDDAEQFFIHVGGLYRIDVHVI